MRSAVSSFCVLLAIVAATAPAGAQVGNNNNQDNRAGGGATTVQLPTFGVAIDAQGVVSLKSFEDPTGRLHAERLQAARSQLPKDLAARAPLRKVSLVKLEAALRRALDDGRKPDEAMRCLAGLQRVQYCFCLPEEKDIVIAGPAEGFAADAAGRVVGLASGRPVIELQDLVVALRAFPPGQVKRPFIGCTIDPTTEAMLRLQQFQKQVPAAVPENRRGEVGATLANGMREALGNAPIRVFGIAAETHFAQVLVEADYRMKLIGIGLETPPVRIPSYFEMLSGAGLRHNALQRWWFTPSYECLRVTDDRLGVELVGDGVQLLTENKLVGPDGQLNSGAPGNKASDTFALTFTRKYPELAARSPVYAQLRNLVDLLVLAAYIEKQGFVERVGWKMATFGHEAAFAVNTYPAPRQAPSAVNAAWRGSRFIAVAGGGVSIRPDEALTNENLLSDKNGKLGEQRSKLSPPVAADRWWWD